MDFKELIQTITGNGRSTITDLKNNMEEKTRIEDKNKSDTIKSTEQKEEALNKEPFYLPYNVKYIQNGYRINCYVKNGINQVTVEYEVPDKGSENKEVKFVMATAPTTKGHMQEVISLLRNFFTVASKYNSLDSIQPEQYVAKLKEMGWESSNEGMDIMQTTKRDEDVEIMKTVFLQEEITNISQEEREENGNRHVNVRECQIITEIEEYIIGAYLKMNKDNSEEYTDADKKRIEKILKLSFDKKSGIESNMAIAQLHPIQQTKAINVMEKIYNKEIREYISQISDKYRFKETEKNIERYLKIRDTFIKEREDNIISQRELPFGAICIYDLYRFIEELDEKLEIKKKVKRENLQNKANVIVERKRGKTNNTEAQKLGTDR